MTKLWTVRIEQDGWGHPIITIPDQIVEMMGLSEGDVIKWIDNNNGTWTLEKENEDCECENCGCHKTSSSSL